MQSVRSLYVFSSILHINSRTELIGSCPLLVSTCCASLNKSTNIVLTSKGQECINTSSYWSGLTFNSQTPNPLFFPIFQDLAHLGYDLVLALVLICHFIFVLFCLCFCFCSVLFLFVLFCFMFLFVFAFCSLGTFNKIRLVQKQVRTLIHACNSLFLQDLFKCLNCNLCKLASLLTN